MLHIKGRLYCHQNTAAMRRRLRSALRLQQCSIVSRRDGMPIRVGTGFLH
jgi:hypothetical protein